MKTYLDCIPCFFKQALEAANARIDELEVKLQRTALPLAATPNEGSQTGESKARNAAFFKWIRGGETALNPEERKALVEDATLVASYGVKITEVENLYIPSVIQCGVVGNRVLYEDRIGQRPFSCSIPFNKNLVTPNKVVNVPVPHGVGTLKGLLVGVSVKYDAETAELSQDCEFVELVA